MIVEESVDSETVGRLGVQTEGDTAAEGPVESAETTGVALISTSWLKQCASDKIIVNIAVEIGIQIRSSIHWRYREIWMYNPFFEISSTYSNRDQII